jgi:tetratricopeptide (TPR) repeat protein
VLLEVVLQSIVTETELREAIRRMERRTSPELVDRVRAELLDAITERFAAGGYPSRVIPLKRRFIDGNRAVEAFVAWQVRSGIQIVRYDVIRTSSGWRVYDYCVTSSNYRLSVVAASAIAQRLGDFASRGLQRLDTHIELMARAMAAAIAGNTDDARRLVALVAADEPHAFLTPGIALIRGATEVSADDFDAAIDALTPIRELIYEYPRFDLVFSRIALARGDAETAEPFASRYIETVGDDPNGLAILASARMLTGDIDGAREAAQRGLQVAPNDAQLLKSLATADAPIIGPAMPPLSDD